VKNKFDRNHKDPTSVSGDAKEPAKFATHGSAWKALDISVPANCRFRTEDWVYNRDTNEHGLIRLVYEKDGVIMYEAWLPATPNSLRWGHFVSDWAEGVLEPSDRIPGPSACLPDGS
jgi:hypothetical protein